MFAAALSPEAYPDDIARHGHRIKISRVFRGKPRTSRWVAAAVLSLMAFIPINTGSLREI
jgi:hypothetical protein